MPRVAVKPKALALLWQGLPQRPVLASIRGQRTSKAQLQTLQSECAKRLSPGVIPKGRVPRGAPAAGMWHVELTKRHRKASNLLRLLWETVCKRAGRRLAVTALKKGWRV